MQVTKFGLALVMSAAVVALAGCSGGIAVSQTKTSESFTVKTDYASAWRRAREFARVCYVQANHPYSMRYSTNESFDDRDTRGRVEIYQTPSPQSILEIITTEPGANSALTKVTVEVEGKAPWDKNEIQFAQRSITSASPQCQPGV